MARAADDACVPSSDPVGDELGGWDDEGTVQGWSETHGPLDEPADASPISASERILRAARERARAAPDEPLALADLDGMDDDSDDEMLTQAPRRQPRRAAAERHAPYLLKLSLQRPGDAATQRQRGRPAPLVSAKPRAAPSRYALDALRRDKARQQRLGMSAAHFAELDVLAAQWNAPAPAALDVRATLEAALGHDAARDMTEMLGRDAAPRHEARTSVSPLWDAAPSGASSPCATDAMLGLPWPELLSDDAHTARAAQARHATDGVQALQELPSLLRSWGASVDVLQEATACAPLAARPFPSARILHAVAVRAATVESHPLAALGERLPRPQQALLVRLLPRSLTTPDGTPVRVAVAWRLLAPHAPLDLHDLGGVAADLHEATEAVRCKGAPAAPLRGHLQLVGLLLSDLPRYLAEDARGMLAALPALMQAISHGPRMMRERRDAPTEQSAIKDVAQRLALRLWYEARAWVEGSAARTALRPLLEPLAPQRAPQV